MAKVAFKKGLLANLPAAISEGTFYITTDERAMYLDVDGSTRVRIGDFQEFATLAALQANTNPSTTALYYVAELNCLAKWNGTAYVQINLDTGATSVEVVGDGNAVTAASYDAATRKLTLTAGATYATPGDVDTKIAAKVGDLGDSATVKAYVDAKTSGIASDEVLNALAGRVSTLEGSDAGKSVRTIANEELAAQLIPENAQESMDTLAEIAAWIQAHPDDAAAMNASIAALQAIVDGIGGEGEKPTVVAYVTDAIAALKIGDYAKAADLTALASRMGTAEGKLDTLTGADTVEGSVAKALKDAKAYTDEKDTAMDTRMDAVEGTAHEHTNKDELDKIAFGDKAKWDAAEQNAKTYADGLLTWGSF